MIGLQGQHVRLITKDETLDIVRQLSAIYRDGKLQKYETYEFKIKCNVQPVNGRDLLMVPEGDRFKEQYWIHVENYTPVPVEADIVKPFPPDSSLLVNDRVVRLGVNFQVQSVENWGKYSRARVMRLDIGPNVTP